ncbi:SH3 and multiple ankyrin repeat domains protein 3-like isoform X2 [Dreissena polymorpha]|uniref:SH3 and multiple ankyrin repeat domains protein 3 n=1 Tax=Dreissena polymorpha TaxID=45954 RepID=A0A9D4D5S1_DREPO|nr:SH3 and multiple ankyrin repeat domains protein 3-like isoform X2 [Dreissena polymorpha]XP_052238794.1 SH3 and multiple ankyrin repeat domains protein 3-like isoform X2 [Dreissena polymorpha]XP_052238795.1 SH3 and multiple ankyrin repeat domains protein 3-like isoform X2 [Dreissena polymorpha]XP_052238796.1 SH3 and multiple ankyrin repeat domains protein 3-like isoform X2 [Dreissena polymorpha]XP_052238797.1 SH3 and multiple ankyrin repeat domains protein 3-like isoform X2 [Dreissena polymor
MADDRGGTMRSIDQTPRGTLRNRDENPTLYREMAVDRRSTLRDAQFGTMSSYMSEHHTGTVFIRVSVQDLKVQKCLQFELDETVWEAKQRILAVFSKDLKDALNYGIYMPPMNGRAGKFLEEERLLREYPLHGPIGFVEFKYKRRVYKVIHLNARKLKQLHNKTNYRQFMENVKQGNVSKINKLTTKGMDPNFHDSAGETPLSYAVSLPKERCREMTIALFSGGAHLDFRTRQGQTPMHKAILNGNQAAVKALLDLGASTNYKDGKGLTPLYYSVLYGKNATCAEMLLHERALIGCRDENGWYEIHQACKLNLIQHLEHLMFYGADLDVTNASGNTALHICAVNNNEQCARILLFRGANKHVGNFNNQTPQQVAIIAGNVALSELIKNFEETDVVPFRELPSVSERRPRLSMYASTMSLISRSRSDPKLNVTMAMDDSSVVSPPGSMRSLPHQYNMYSDSGSYSASKGSNSPRSMSISSNSSGHVASVADTGYWEGSVGDREGWFPAHHVQEVRLRNKANSMGDLLAEDSGVTLRAHNRNTLATLVRQDTSDYGPRTVVLQRAPEGYGFVLRGAKSQMRPNGDLDFRPTPEFPALQYLDSVDPGSVSDRAGLKGGDFILEINGENVVRASHDRVVHLIRSTGNTLAMKVVTVQLGNRGQDWFINEQDRNLTMPNRQKKKAAPMPPHRDPRTSLSISKSEGQAMAEEMAAMAKLDLAIGEKREEEKIASIRSRTAAKRVSVVDIENMGVEGKLERAKSTPDLLEANKVTKHYATPTVPDDHRKYVITSSGSTSPSGAVSRPKAAPPVPPGADNSPKKQAPRPPSEVVTINTNMGSPYASSKVVVTSTTKSDYESSFRPGDSAKLADEPNEGPKGHNRSPSAGAVLVRQGGAVETEKTNVSFADDKVLDRAASFLKKHPNAKLLMTAKGQESLRNRTSMRMSLHSSEPDPDYDSDSGDEKPDSPRKTQDPKTQSVTVISVGDQNKKMAPAPSQAAKRYTIHSSIPSDDKGFVIPPKPDVPAPSPPVQARHESPKKSSSSPQQSNRMAVKVEINTRQFDSEPPQLPSTPPPDFIGSGPLINIPKAPAPPALVSNGTPPPPPPPPPPPAPTSEEIRKTKSSASMDYISTSVPHNAIAAAVAKRQERLQNGGPQMAEVKAKPEIPQMDPTQAAIIAAVMKRRQQLEKQDENMVIDSIESRLQKTKKLQAAKFSLAGNKPLKTEAKPNEGNKPVSPVQSSVKPLGPKTSPAPVKMEKEEFSFKVEPVKEINTINKNQPGLTQIKPNFSSPAKNTKPVIETKQTNGISKGKPVEGLNIKPLEKSSTTTSESNKSSERLTTAMVETNNNTSDNGKTDYLALAEKKRLEWLQKKQKSSESKSSPSGTPERDLVKSKTVEINGKPKPLSNGDVYKNVPPPPLGFRDGGKTNANIVQLEIIPPPEHFSSDGGSEPNTQQNSPAFSPDTASLVSSLSTLSSLSGEGRSNGYEELIAPPPPGFGDDSSSYIPPPPEFGNVNVKKTFSDKAIDQWFGNDVLDWLDSLNMSQYKASFQRNSVDGKKLLDLSRDNYIDLGVTQVGHRMTIERAIKKAEIKQKTSHEVIAVEHL